ncbi:MAG: hypothetical protein IT555_12245 [Acetobacteraceae bacterium]|nr:hypothetical protein [Acetobacteraceae bacterium]
MSLNWYFGIAALGIWVVASLLYLRRYLAVWIGAWLQRRRAAQERK